MIKVCGINEECQLIRESNNQSLNDDLDFSIISPPLDIKSDSFLSCSFYSDHTAIITRDGALQIVGNNHGTRPRFIEKLTNIPLADDGGHQLYPITALCGYLYTLFIVSTSASTNDGTQRLAFFSERAKSRSPIIVPTGSHKPTAIFGGDSNAVAIDSDGGIIFLRRDIEFRTKTVSAPRGVLPCGEPPVCVACLYSYFFVVGSSGLVFMSEVEKPTEFKIVSELSAVNIVEVSGSCMHCIAVSSDGRVFVRGRYNQDINLGFAGRDENKFCEIPELKRFKIISASAGASHSLFVTDTGKVLACGANYYGQLFINYDPSKDYYTTPVETIITCGASYAIAGSEVSAVFIGEVPPNTPNRSLCSNHNNNKSQNQTKNSSTTAATTSSQPINLEKNQDSASKVKDTKKKEDNTSKGEFDKKEKESDNTLDENDAGIKGIMDAFKDIQDVLDGTT